jgi:hypothetical protein
MTGGKVASDERDDGGNGQWWVLAFGSGNGQQDDNCVQWCWQWTTARWWSEDGAVPAVSSKSVIDDGNGGNNEQPQWWGGGQWKWR